MSCEGVVVFARSEPVIEAGPVAEEKCVRGRPEHRTWNHFTSADGRCFAGFWEGDPGCIRVDYTENEYCHLLEGRVILRDDEGGELRFEPGDDFVIPAGFKGEWETIEKARKIYVVYQP